MGLKRLGLGCLALLLPLLLLAGCRQGDDWKRQRIEKFSPGSQLVWEVEAKEEVEAFFALCYGPDGEEGEYAPLPEGAALLGEFVFSQEETRKLGQKRPAVPAYHETSRAALYQSEGDYYLVERVKDLPIAASTRKLPQETGEALAALGENPQP